MWDASLGDLLAVRSALAGVPVFVCTWDRRASWPGASGVVHLPFNAERVAHLLYSAARDRDGAASCSLA